MDEPNPVETRALLRDVAVFQFKLLVDALRDIVLSPLTLGATFIDLLLSGQQAPRYFRWMLLLGQRSEAWIDLWAAAYRGDGEKAANVDALLLRVEEAVRDPQTGAHRARVLKRWAEMALARRARRTANDLMQRRESTRQHQPTDSAERVD